MSLHNFLCILISRSLPNLKEKYMTAFRHKLIHNCITQSKASRSIIMAANGGNVPHLGRLLHHTQHARSRWCIVQCTPLHCNTLECTINLMIVGLLSTALFQYLKCQDQRISKNCRSTFLFCSYEISKGARFLHLACQGGRRAPLSLSVTPLFLAYFLCILNSYIL